MAIPIRPLPSSITPASPPRNVQALEAQRAFFAQALGKAAPAAAAVPLAPVFQARTAPAPTPAAQQADDDAPRYPRPGSKLDITV